MDIDNWDEEQDKNRKLDKYEINESMDLDDIDDILCKEYENFEYKFRHPLKQQYLSRTRSH